MRDDLLDAQASDFRGLCMAIGFVALNWALAEQQIDILVNIAFRHCGGRELRKNNGVPRSLKLKLEFLRDCFRTLTLLKPHAGEGCAFIDRVRTLSAERHDLIHGSLQNLEHVNGTYLFHKIKYHQDGHSVSSFTFGPEDFAKLEKAHGDLITELIQFSLRLGEQFPE